jgi:hypothetical protein
MRALIWGMLVVTGLWSGYWWIGASGLENGVNAWIAQQDGRVTAEKVEVHGIPNRFDLTVTAPVFTDPASGLAVSSPFLQVYAMTWKPWHVIAALPSGQVITLADQKVTLGSDKLRASVQVHPTTRLSLQEIVVEVEALRLTSDAGWAVSLQSGLASMAEDIGQTNSYRLGLKVDQITPDAGLMQALTATDLPKVVDEIYLDAHATLTAPLDRYAGDLQPKLTKFSLAQARATWGALKFSATGALEAGADGLATGKIDLRIEGWKRLPPILAALGLVKADVAPTVENMLGILAAQGGDPQVLAISLICKDGRMSLGPLPLGAAPRLN